MPTESASRRAPAAFSLKSNALTLSAVAGYVVAFVVAVAGFSIANAERSADAMARFGNSMADDLAHLAIEPVLRGDRIQLGLLANRLAARPEVHRIEVHTVDGKLFVVAGGPALRAAPAYLRAIAVQDTVAGDVTVTLNADSFRFPAHRLLAETWQFALGGLAVTIFAFHFGSRARLAGLATGSASEVAKERRTKPGFVVVAEVSRSTESGSANRERLLERGMVIARRVANLYAGQCLGLSRGGIVMQFPSSVSRDRGFEVVCAALLARDLLAAVAPVAVAEPGGVEEAGTKPPPVVHAFRYGIDLAQTGIVVHDDGVHASSVSDALLLASLAGGGELVMGQAAYDALDRPERVEIEDLENPATEALSSGVARPRGVVRRVAGEYGSLLARQTEVIAKALGPTSGY